MLWKIVEVDSVEGEMSDFIFLKLHALTESGRQSPRGYHRANINNSC